MFCVFGVCRLRSAYRQFAQFLGFVFQGIPVVCVITGSLQKLILLELASSWILKSQTLLSWSSSKPFLSDAGISVLATLKIALGLFLNRKIAQGGGSWLLNSWLTMSSWHSEWLVNSFHYKTFLLDLSPRNVIPCYNFPRRLKKWPFVGGYTWCFRMVFAV